MTAVSHGRFEILKKLFELRNKKNIQWIINDRDSSQQTALHIAIADKRTNTDIVHYLLSKGANPNLKDNQAATPRAIAEDLTQKMIDGSDLKQEYSNIIDLLKKREQQSAGIKPISITLQRYLPHVVTILAAFGLYKAIKYYKKKNRERIEKYLKQLVHQYQRKTISYEEYHQKVEKLIHGLDKQDQQKLRILYSSPIIFVASPPVSEELATESLWAA